MKKFDIPYCLPVCHDYHKNLKNLLRTNKNLKSILLFSNNRIRNYGIAIYFFQIFTDINNDVLLLKKTKMSSVHFHGKIALFAPQGTNMKNIVIKFSKRTWSSYTRLE